VFRWSLREAAVLSGHGGELIKIINIVLTDKFWPNLMCEVSDWSGNCTGRISLYDTSGSNFEPLVTNVLHKAVRDIIQENKNGRQGQKSDEGVQARETAQRVEERPKSKVTRASRGHSPQRKTKGKVK
jgi:hypothetical protein